MAMHLFHVLRDCYELPDMGTLGTELTSSTTVLCPLSL